MANRVCFLSRCLLMRRKRRDLMDFGLLKRFSDNSSRIICQCCINATKSGKVAVCYSDFWPETESFIRRVKA